MHATKILCVDYKNCLHTKSADPSILVMSFLKYPVFLTVLETGRSRKPEDGVQLWVLTLSLTTRGALDGGILCCVGGDPWGITTAHILTNFSVVTSFIFQFPLLSGPAKKGDICLKIQRFISPNQRITACAQTRTYICNLGD